MHIVVIGEITVHLGPASFGLGPSTFWSEWWDLSTLLLFGPKSLAHAGR